MHNFSWMKLPIAKVFISNVMAVTLSSKDSFWISHSQVCNWIFWWSIMWVHKDFNINRWSVLITVVNCTSCLKCIHSLPKKRERERGRQRRRMRKRGWERDIDWLSYLKMLDNDNIGIDHSSVWIFKSTF